jgi:hypothetical protein
MTAGLLPDDRIVLQMKVLSSARKVIPQGQPR